jgi:hypothetical protein
MWKTHLVRQTPEIEIEMLVRLPANRTASLIKFLPHAGSVLPYQTGSQVQRNEDWSLEK